jgi:hypothetical protein
MTQRLINLLPDSYRAQSEAGVVAGRYVVSLLIAVVLLGLAATHSRLMLDLARQRLRVAEEQADLALSADTRAAQLREQLDDSRNFIRRYQLIALPIEISRVVATLTNILPESATVDRLDLATRTTQTARSTKRRRPAADGVVFRTLTGELSGFASTDQDVAELVTRIEDIGLFEQVSLDFSRSRSVRGKNARGFRISFSADLTTQFEVIDRNGEAAHVQ